VCECVCVFHATARVGYGGVCTRVRYSGIRTRAGHSVCAIQ